LGREAAKDIHSRGDGFKVCGVDAAPHPASVIQFKSIRNLTFRLFVGHNVRVPMTPAGPDAAVASIERREPDHATAVRFGYRVMFKPFGERHCGGSMRLASACQSGAPSQLRFGGSTNSTYQTGASARGCARTLHRCG
jgi:hypothetical protein